MHPLLRAVFLLSLPLLPLHADVHLPAIFGDHMVLQRDGAVPVWGKADPGEDVSVEAGTVRGGAVAGADGKWMVRLSGLPASTQPIDVTVRGKNTVVFHDVLVGDVWLCTGQSNMELGITNDTAAAEEIPKADHPSIRLFFVPVSTLPAPADEMAARKEGSTEGRWLVCSPQTVVLNGAGGFSAAGYFFGRDIAAATGQPVGLVGCYLGATPAQAWTSLEALQKVPALQAYADRGKDQRDHFDDLVRTYKETLLPQWQAACEKWKADNAPAWAAYQAALQQWQDDREKAKAANLPLPAQAQPKNPLPAAPVDPATERHIPTVLFNGMVSPLIPYGIKGAIWYQGEGNSSRPAEYRTLLPTLIGDWRARWGQGDFPFLIVQLASFLPRKPEPSESSLAALREAQAKTLLAAPNTALALAIDIGEANDIHPRDKYDVGARLALAARKVAYGEALVFSGPAFREATAEEGRMRIAFDNVGGGLVVGVPPPHYHPGTPRPDTATLRGFAVAGEDGKFAWADAAIEGNTVVVSSPKVAKPVAVRYGWADNPDCNLYNREGLPAIPFRTDAYPVGEEARAR